MTALYAGAIVIGDHDLRVVLKPIPPNTMNLFLAWNSLTNGKVNSATGTCCYQTL